MAVQNINSFTNKPFNHKLSKRMRMNVQMIDEKRIADIGCDHAFVSICLIEEKIADKVVALDVRKGPVEIATKNVLQSGLSDKIDVRLSDGFDKLSVSEVDCALIAGMGGPLMVQILERGKTHTDMGVHLVLQPQSDQEQVRRYLYDINYQIVQEDMLMEEGKYYVTMKAVPYAETKCEKKEMLKVEAVFGKILLESRNIVLKQYLIEKYKKNLELFDDLSHIYSSGANKRVLSLEDEICLIKEALSYYE